MLAQADFQRALALALGELAPAWTIVGECSPVDRLDASHWGSGPQSFQVTASISAPSAASAIGGHDGGEADLDGPPQRASRPWSLSIRKSKSPTLPMVTSPAAREVPPGPSPSRGVREAPTVEARKPMLGRLKRELEIWYWRRGASGQDKSHARD